MSHMGGVNFCYWWSTGWQVSVVLHPGSRGAHLGFLAAMVYAPQGEDGKTRSKEFGYLDFGDVDRLMTACEHGDRSVFDLPADPKMPAGLPPDYVPLDKLKESRRCPRARLSTRVPVYDLGTGSSGILRDISVTGIRVAGLAASVGQVGKFQIPIDMFMQADPLLVAAECKWAERKGNMKEYIVAGFEIIDLPANDRNTLQNFIAVLPN